MNTEAILAAIEQAKVALDEIEVAAAGEPAEEPAPEAPPEEEGGTPMGGMMGRKPMMGG